MTTLVFSNADTDTVRPATPVEAIVEGFRMALAIHREQRMILKLSRLNDRMLEDMGFDPQIVRATRRDVWARFD
jgi:hypothetical protein